MRCSHLNRALCFSRNWDKLVDIEILFKVVTPVIAIFSLVISMMSFRNSKRKNQLDFQIQEDKELSEYAISLLESAYKALTDNGESVSPPKASRLNWLTAARYIMRFYALRKNLMTERYKLICDENAEQWRHEFYKLLKSNEFNNPGYFSGKHMLQSSENIEPNSAVVIIEFARWSETYEDPIDSYDYKKTIASSPRILDGQIGLQVYLSNLESERAVKAEQQT